MKKEGNKKFVTGQAQDIFPNLISKKCLNLDQKPVTDRFYCTAGLPLMLKLTSPTVTRVIGNTPIRFFDKETQELVVRRTAYNLVFLGSRKQYGGGDTVKQGV